MPDSSHITPEMCEVYAQCRSCGLWTFIQGEPENYGNQTNNKKCEHCESGMLDPQSVTSKRTFNPEKAKARTARVVSENKRSARS
jgi:hypothetical protein